MRENNIILYNTPTGNVKVEVIFNNETFWLTQKRMAELFGCSSDNISLHLKNIFASNELVQNAVTEDFSATASDGKKYTTKFYNLDAIIAVGYRVNSKEATQFRIWATQTLKEFIIKGFVLNDDMLKNGKPFGKDYLAEFQARRNQLMNMKDWLERTNKFLESNSLEVLPNAGSISHEQAIDKAHTEYEQFRIDQDKKFVSEMDKAMKKLSNS
jgi:hypothetical protein